MPTKETIHSFDEQLVELLAAIDSDSPFGCVKAKAESLLKMFKGHAGEPGALVHGDWRKSWPLQQFIANFYFAWEENPSREGRDLVNLLFNSLGRLIADSPSHRSQKRHTIAIAEAIRDYLDWREISPSSAGPLPQEAEREPLAEEQQKAPELSRVVTYKDLRSKLDISQDALKRRLIEGERHEKGKYRHVKPHATARKFQVVVSDFPETFHSWLRDRKRARLGDKAVDFSGQVRITPTKSESASLPR